MSFECQVVFFSVIRNTLEEDTKTVCQHTCKHWFFIVIKSISCQKGYGELWLQTVLFNFGCYYNHWCGLCLIISQLNSNALRNLTILWNIESECISLVRCIDYHSCKFASFISLFCAGFGQFKNDSFYMHLSVLVMNDFEMLQCDAVRVQYLRNISLP